MTHSYRSTEFVITAVGSGGGLGLLLVGALLAVEGARSSSHELATVGLVLCATGAVLVAILAFAYARSRGVAKSPAARIFGRGL
jgi:hypothetical protein